jgi:hypothetical protein
MKILIVTAAIAAAFASAAFAETITQPASKPLIFAQAKPSPTTVAKRKLKNGKTMTKGKAEHCADPTHDVVEDGDFIGCDPDPTVRLMMKQEYKDGGGSAGGD